MVKIVCSKCGSTDIEADPHINIHPKNILGHILSRGEKPVFDATVPHTIKCKKCGNVIEIPAQKPVK